VEKRSGSDLQPRSVTSDRRDLHPGWTEYRTSSPW
jgi:hypothetical protein